MKSKLNFLAKVMVITLSWQLFVFCLAGMLGGSDILYYIHNYHPLKEILGYCFENSFVPFLYLYMKVKKGGNNNESNKKTTPTATT